jgi:hypothetical protein
VFLLGGLTFGQAMKNAADTAQSMPEADQEGWMRRYLAPLLFAAGTERRMAGDEQGARKFFTECASLTNPLVEYEWYLAKGDTPQRVPLHDHHIFPQQFRQYFKQRGIDIDQFTVTMDAPTHLEGVHGAGIDGMPGQWNRAWADFIARNPNATRQQIFDFAGELMKRYGISTSEIHPYGQSP